MTFIAKLIVDFENLAGNGFNLSSDVKSQGWESYFDLFRGPTYPELVKEVWNNAFVLDKITICS